MSRFLSPPSAPQEEPAPTASSLLFGDWVPDTFQARSIRELQQIKNNTPREIGFIDKITTAFSNETVIGELFRWMDTPDFVDKGYLVTDEDITKFAGDLDPEAAERAALEARSLEEFIYEADQIRTTTRKRAELFSGGPLGMAVGMGSTLVAAGSEAVALSILASAAGTLIAGPAGTAAAGGAVAASRVSRLQKIFSGLRSMQGARRAEGAIRGAGTAALIDVPLELTRYELDKTLKPQDLIIALGSSAVLTGAVGAWKPHMFSRHLLEASETAAKREASDVARAAGRDDVADEIDQSLRQEVRVLSFDDEVDEISALKGKALTAEAKKWGISVGEGKKAPRRPSDIRGDLLLARRDAKTKGISDQLGDEWRGTGLKAEKDTKAQIEAHRAKLGRDVGVPEDIIKVGGDKLKAAILKARLFAAEHGHVIVGAVPELARGLRAPMKRSTTIGGTKYNLEFDSVIEAALWAAAKARNASTRSSLLKWLKEEAGIENAEDAANQFVKETRQRAGLEGAETVKARATGLQRVVKGETRVLEEGQPVSTLFETKKQVKVTSKTQPKKAEAEAEVHPQEGPETVAVVNGKPVATGPSEIMEAVTEEAAAAPPQLTTTTGHGKGGRETASRAINWYPGEKWGRVIQGVFKFFTPLHTVLMKSPSPRVRSFADIFLDNPVGGAKTVMGNTKLRVDAAMAVLGNKLNDALEEARRQGIKLSEKEIYRAYRDEFTPEGPLGDIVRALQEHYKSMLRLGKEGGVLDESIPESFSYLQRRYNSTKFNEMIEKFGEDKIEEFFAQAILRKSASESVKMTQAKAVIIARRIVKFGKNPEAVRSEKGSQLQLDNIRKSLTKDLEDAGLDDVKGQVDDFMDMIYPRVEGEPHIKHKITANRHRIQLDETHHQDFTPIKGGPLERIHFDDFVGGRGGEEIMDDANRYAHQIIGAVEARRGMKELFGKPNITQAEAVAKLKDSITNPREQQFIEKVFNHTYNSTVGKRVYPDSWLMRLSMGVNAFNQATIGMTLGFAQLPEIASIICRSGPQAAFQQLPQLNEIAKIFTMGIRDLATGRRGLGMEGLRKTKDDLAACIQSFTGIGADYIKRDHLMRRVDDFGFDSDYMTGKFQGFMEWGRQASALNPLGIMPMDTFLRRWAGNASFQHFVNTAYEIKGGKAVLSKGFWKNSEVRFAQLGLDADDITRLSKVLRDTDAVVTEPGMFGRYTVKRFDFSKTEDQYIVDKFAYALRRHSDHMVQRQSYGESPYWVNTELGKLFGQYRVFMLASRAKQAAMGAARGDAYEIANVVGSFSLGILAYYLQTYYRSSGMSGEERADYLDQRLSSEWLIKSGFVKGSYSSVLPMFMDTTSSWLTGETIFDPSMRTTGQGVSLIKGSTAWTTGSKVERALKEIFGSVRGDDPLAQKDLQNAASLLWFTKLPGVDQSLRSLIHKTPLPTED